MPRSLTYKSTDTCGECPFTKEGIRGYTGPYETPLDLHRAGMEHEYPCHNRGRQQCVGVQMYRKVNCKSLVDHDPKTQAHQQAVLAAHPNYEELTFNLLQFMAHHDRDKLREEINANRTRD